MSKMKLNRQQLAAVRHLRGPSLIIAGAGTGKTTVITEKILRLISTKKALPDEILALTFTEKAAGEMEERIDVALPLGHSQVWIMTFHSFCDRLLRDDGLHIGLNPTYRILKDADRMSLLKKHFFDLPLDYFRPLGNPNKFISALLNHFDRLRDEDVSPTGYLSWANNLSESSDERESVLLEKKQYLELATAYLFYEDLKIKNDSLDFADLIKFSLNLFRTRPNILSRYWQKFKYILVDEYQDTNYSQNLLVSLLSQKSHNLTVVADDDQSIYRWRGAALSNIIQFRRNYPDASLTVLSQNYRSTQEILDSAYQLIQHNNPDRLEVSEKISKRLTSFSHRHGVYPQLLHYQNLSAEVAGVVETIVNLIEQDNYRPADICILVRANAHAQPFISALENQGIPCRFNGPSSLFEKTKVKDLICYLRVLAHPSDDQSLYRVMSLEFFHFDQRDLLLITELAHTHHLPLLNICERITEFLPDRPQEKLVEKITSFASLIDSQIEVSKHQSPGQLLFSFLKTTGVFKKILQQDSDLNPDEASDIVNFFNRLKLFETENPHCTIQEILDWIEISSEAGESFNLPLEDASSSDSVNVLTVHSAKGLEFPVVFLVNLVSQRFPTSEKKDLIPIPDQLIKEPLPSVDAHLQEERRLFYVAMTRARSKLFLTASDYYGDGKRLKKLSPFISESQIPTSSQTDISVSGSPQTILPPSMPRENDHVVTYLNYSRIRTFLDCPLHYQAKYLLNIPTPPTAASTFGNIMHQTLKKYHDLISEHESPDILKIYSHYWTNVGFDSVGHAQAYYQRGEEFLTGFITANPFPVLPVKLEDPFTITLKTGLKIGGKIDRANLTPDGILEIVDYKTGASKLDAKQARKDLQLSIYALAARDLPTFPYSKPPEFIKLCLYYFDTQQTVITTRTAQELVEAEDEIISYAQQISQSDFQCSKSIICQGKCDYRYLCDL